MIKPLPKNQDGALLAQNKNDATILCVRRQNMNVSLFIKNDRLESIAADPGKERLKGMICIAKVMDIVPNIGAAFLRIRDNRTCYISMEELQPCFNLSRKEKKPVQGDNVLVQIVKEAAKGKEATASTKISLEGEFCVVTPGDGHLAYSHQLTDTVKKQIGKFFDENNFSVPEHISVVIRTAAGTVADFNLIRKELFDLITQLNDLMEQARMRTDYSVLKEPEEDWLAFLKKPEAAGCSRILTDDENLFHKIEMFCKENCPDLSDKIHFYQDKLVSLGVLFGVEGKLSEALNKKVWLKSGGFILIEHTEALTVIDVNSGKFDKKGEKEDTFFRVNMEAAEEIARQLILRNLSGIIIVDFINMKNKENNEKLVKFLEKLFQNDSNFARIVDVTKLGLMEITRKKTGKPLYEQLFCQSYEKRLEI